MIVGVPDARELNETALGWFHLAWETAIDESVKFQNIESYLDGLRDEHGSSTVDQEILNYWHERGYKLNNSLTLLQQSIKIFIKSKIVEVSPYLLIAGEPQSWPRSNSDGDVNFSDFRTIDAANLCRAANSVCKEQLSQQFTTFYERLRRTRNKIVHLNEGSVHVEVRRVLVEILDAHRLLFPGQEWSAFRRNYLVVTGDYESEIFKFEDDPTHTRFMEELRATFGELSIEDAIRFFGFDPKRMNLECPRCLTLRSQFDDHDCIFARRSRGKKIHCVACGSIFSLIEYNDLMEEVR